MIEDEESHVMKIIKALKITLIALKTFSFCLKGCFNLKLFVVLLKQKLFLLQKQREEVKVLPRKTSSSCLI